MLGRKRKRRQRSDNSVYIHFESSDGPVPENVKQLFVDSCVSHLSQDFCWNRTSLVEVYLPIGLKSIGVGAFRSCVRLGKISIPFTVETIEESAFAQCFALDQVCLSEGLNVIGVDAFFECKGLARISIPSTVTVIKHSAFRACIALRSIELPTGLREIPGRAFDMCSSLQGIKIPSNVWLISDYAFVNCRELRSVDIPYYGMLAKLGASVFRGCTSLTRIRLPPDIKSIGKYCFRDCVNLVTVELEPASSSFVFNFWYEVFRGCRKLTNICLPRNSLVSSTCFTGCEYLLNQYGVHNVIDALECRFGYSHVHSLCYHSHSTGQDTLRGNIELFKTVDGDFNNTVDAFGRTPFHILASSATSDKLFLLEILLESYPSHMLGWKDKYGLTAIEYLEPGKDDLSWIPWYEKILQNWMIQPLLRWGKEHWISKMTSMVQTCLLEKGNMLSTAIWRFESYEAHETISLLELWLWRMQILVLRKQTFFSRQSVDRAHCRSISGASFVIPSVMEFVAFDPASLLLSDSDDESDYESDCSDHPID